MSHNSIPLTVKTEEILIVTDSNDEIIEVFLDDSEDILIDILEIGPTGPTGATGAAGADGSVWFNSAGVPSNGVGADTDFNLDTTTGNVYQKVAGSWGAPVTNIIGPTGATGADGADGTNGINGTNGTDGNDGADGADGATWQTSSGVPSDVTGVDGDFNLNTLNGDVYQKVAGTWGAPIANITGPTGPAGATVASGVSITDSGAFYTGTDVEAALQEVGTSLQNNAVTDADNNWSTDQTHSNNKVINPQLQGYSEAIGTASSAAGTLAIDVTASNVYTTTLTENVSTLNFTWPSSGAGIVTVYYSQDATGGFSIADPTGGVWDENGAPTLNTTALKRTIITYSTVDGGTTVFMALGGTGY